MQVIYVTHFDPLPVGHGGVHRSYQILHDLEAVVGQGNVTIVKVWLQWWKLPAPLGNTQPVIQHLTGKVKRNAHRLTDLSLYTRQARRIGQSLQRRVESVSTALGNYAENPFKLLAKTDYTTHSCRNPRFLSDYEKTLQQIRPTLCVIEHTTFADVIPLNQQRGIPTLCCPQNLEAFDLMALDGKWSLNSAALDFANEIRVLAECDQRLFISQLETALVSGLGLAARYYPYVPVGEIREQHAQICAERSEVPRAPGLFVMLGSAEHGTTREAFEWFIQQAKTRGLPRGAQVVIAGSATHTLLPDGATVPGIQLRGWLEQTELHDLLLRAQAMLIPQRRGFGALTRLPEFACAGIPVIVSRHPTYALDLPPGARVADNEWREWCAHIEAIMTESPRVSAEDYAEWEARQPRPLSAVVGERSRS